MPCAGNSAEMCGADRRISVYRPGKIAAITASSEYTTNHGATNARLNFKSSSRAWVAATNNADQWLQFDMGQRSTVGVIRTQGRLLSGHYNQWVTSYSISYGNSSGDEMWYKDANGDTIVFTGNSDIDSLVTHVLVDYNGPFHARYVRFRPVTWSNHISMRADIAEVAPVGFWPLNGHTQLRDVSGYGNDATGVGVALANGVHGESEGAYSLSGSSTSYIEIPNNGMLDTRYSMTILAYFYPTGTDGPIFHYRTNDYGVHFWQKDTGYLYARMRTRDNVYKDVLNVDTLNLNEWNFVGMTYNYPLGKVKLWHDGTEVGSRDVGTFETQTDYDIRVGLRDGDSRTLQGRVACLQVYNIPLNSDQIRDAARKCRAQPVGLWPLNKQYGLADISGNGNDVTGVNVALGTGVYGEPEGSYVMSGSSTSYIEVPDDRTLDTRYSLTILASVYPTGGAGPILQYGDSASGVHLWQDSTYFLLARVYSRNATSNQTTQARCLKPNQWNFVGLTYNYSTGMLKLWYEGLELVSTDIGVYELGTNHAARIGAVGSDHFKGSVSCVQIYDVALNKSQIEHAAKLCIGNNIAVGKTATQSSSFPLLYGFIPKAPDAVDGYKGSDTNLPACAHTQLDFEPWWKLDLGGSYVIGRVRLQNRRDGSGNRLEEFQVRVGENSDISQNSICGRTTNQLDDPPESRSITVDCDQPITGRYVSVQLIDRTQYLTLCEVEVFEVQGNDAGWLTLDSSSVTSSAGTPHDDGGTVYDASKTLDGNLFTYWRPTGVTDNNYFVTFDLQEYHWLSKIRVVSYEEDDTATHHIAAFTIKTLDPAGGWGDVTSFSGLAGRQVKAFTGFVALSRYWQVDITQTSHGLEPYVAEIQLYGRLGANIAQGKTAFQSSTYEPYAANRAVDGSSSTWMYAGSCSHTQEESDPRWWVDLGQSYTVDRVVILNRQDCCWGKLNPFNIHIGDSDQVSTNPQCGGDHEIAQSQAFVTILCPSMQGRYVGIRLPGSARALHICEVQVFSGPVPEAVSIEEPTYHCNGDKPSYVTMATKGTITSGDHGWGNYSSDSLCSWTIEAPSGMAVSLTFLTFDLADDGDCLSDYVAVYDGSSQSSELLGRFCEGNPGVVNSTGNLMHVTFVSNSSLEAAGFRATFGSLDIDECATGNGGCSQNCNNTVGSFACSCHDGYSLNSDGASCDDVDECASNNGGCEKTCTNNVGSFQCSCDSGLTLNSNNLTCDDIDECATGNGGCLQNCSNTVGSFACSCHVGYSLNSDGISCDDIDECADSNGGCEHVCTNTEGSFQCSCHLGQTLNGDGLNCDGWGLPETCPTNGLIHLPNNKTYVAPSDEQVDYATAQARCAIIEGTVAVTRDWNELEYFVFYKNCLSSADVFWVGITRQADTWVDSQGTAISDFTAWAPGEPDQDRDCSLIVQGDLSPADQRRDRWRDNSCNGNIRYICESSTNLALGKPAFQTVTVQGAVASRAVDGNTTTFYSGLSCTLNYDNDNAHWFVDLEQSYMISRIVIFNRQDDCCWERLNPFNIHIGDSDQVSTNPKCGGDHEIDGNQVSVTILCPAMQGRYVGIRLPGTARTLNVCEVQVFSSPAAGCPKADYVHFNGVCYKSFAEVKTWDDAKQTCASDGGMLAIPKDSATNTFLANLAEGVNGRWFGMSRANGQWVFEDGQTLTSSDFSNWYPGEPGPGNCVGYWLTESRWDAKGCSNVKGFICQTNEDIDECAAENGGCAQNCTNTIGNFSCSCQTGYKLNDDGFSCDDIDECATANGGCSQNCSNTVGSFACSCHDGYSLNSDGLSCDDVDECASNNGGCEKTCTNNVGSFKCSCDSGLTLNSNNLTCDDIDECADANGGCEHVCTNTEGSFQCSCHLGQTLNGDGLNCDGWDLPETCPTNGLIHLPNNKTYVGPSDEKVDYATAQARCATIEGTVAATQDWNELEYFVFYKNCLSVSESFWLGITRQNETWVDSQGTAMDFTAWAPGEPDQDKNCSRVGANDISDSQRKNMWVDSNCVKKKRYICESSTNLALGKPAFQTVTVQGAVASRAVDGNTTTFYSGLSCTLNYNNDNAHWFVDLEQSYMISRIVIFNRQDDCCWERLNPFNIHIGESDQVSTNPKCGGDHEIDGNQVSVTILCPAMQGRYVGIRLPGTARTLNVCEVQVFSSPVTTAIPTTTSSPTTPAPSTTTEASTTMARSTAGASVSTTSPTTTTSLPSTTAAASSTVDQSITVTAVTTTTPMPDATTAASTTIIRSTAGASVPTTSATTTSLPSSTAATSSTVDRSTTVTPVTTTTPTPDATTAVSTTIVRSTAGASVFTTSATTTSLPSTTAAASSTENMSTKITAITATSPSTTPTPGATTSASTTGIQSTAGAAVSSSTQPSNTAPKTTVTAAESAAETTTSSPTTPAPDTTTAANTTADRSTAGAATSTSAQRTTPAPITTASTAKSTTSAPTTSATDTITAANTTADWSTAGASVSTTSPQTTPGRNTTAEFNTTVSSSTTETGITITPTSMTPALNTRAGNSTKVVSSTTGAAVTNTPDLETVTLVLAIPISWNTSYEDPTSPAFKELEAEIVALISDLYSNVSGFAGVVVQGISRQDTSVAASVGVKFVGGVTSEEEVSTVLATALQSSVLAIGGVAVTAVSIGNMTVTGNSSLCDSFTCADHAVCIEIGDGAKCVCQPGYEGNGTIHCTDIDECATGSHVCLRDELCFNREGSYACASCYPNIALVGAGANSSAPVDIKRRVPFTVQSTVTTDCNVTYFFFFNWTLYSMDGVLPAVKISLPKTVETSGSELSLPKNVLPYGKVVIRLEVTVEETLSGFRVVMFAEQWVNVLSSALVADIAGGSARSLAPGSDIILDASSSTDPDAMVVNSADFTYSWTCDTEIGTPCTYLFGDGGTGQSYTIPSDNVQTNAGWMTVHLSVWFPGRSAGTTSQFLEIFPVGSPSTYIRCFSNCNRKINPSEKIVLVSECSNCEENEQVSYNWTLQEAPDQFGRFDLNWDTETTTGRNLPDVVIKPEVFTALGEYALRLETTLDDGRQGFSEYSFEPNLPPVEGSCTVSPENGTAMVTEFIIACKGFSDIDEPLTYTFLFNTGTASTFSPLYTGTEPQTPPQLLPVGQESRDFVVRIQVQVSDALGATSTVETSVMVLALPVEHSTAVASQLVVGENSPLTKLVREGDAKSLVQMSNSVTSVLNSVPDNASAEAKKAATEAREALVSALTTIKPTSVSSVNLVASALGSATGGGDEVSADSQVAAANSLKNMAGFLQSIPSEDLEIGQIEKSSSFMFTAVVNVMAGSSKVSDKSKSSEDGETDSDQLEKAKQATQDIFNAIDTMNELMINRKRPNEKPTVITQGPFEMALQRQNCRDMRSQIVRPSENSDTWFRIPDASALFGQSCGQSVGLENYHTSLNPYSYADTSGKIKSPVASLKFRGDSGPVGVNDLQVPIDVMMPQKPGAVVVQAERGQTTPTGQDVMSMHTFNVTEAESSVHVTVTPDVEGIPVRLFLGINSAPSRQVYNRTASLPLVVDSLYSIPLGNNTYLRPDPFQWFLAASDLELTGSEQLFLGVDHEPFTNDTTTNSTVKWGDLSEALELGKGGVNFTLNYTLKIFTSKCLFFDEGQQQWISDGCEVGPLTSTYLTHCLCNHLTAFGSDFQFFVAPNSLNILSALQGFANIGENPSVVITIGVLFGLYLVAVIWARWEDKKDVSKVGATVLKGAGRNSQSYQVQVFTGTRANAGTSSQVFLVLKGERGQSGPHVLEDKTRITFKQGAVDTFVVTSPLPLGPIQSAHIWHNNIGPYPSWFLEQVIVTDLQEDAKHVFLCKSWLAVEEGDGKVDREIYKATDKDLTRFGRLFSTKTSKDFRDGHLWFSVIGRPATSPFTRVQRVSCCLSLLMCTMLTNIMFFGKGDTMQKPPPVYILGFEVQFPISWGQIMIGIQSALMVIPVNLLIVQIFRNCAARPSRKIKGKPVDMRHIPRKDPEGRASSASSSGTKADPAFAGKSTTYEVLSEGESTSSAEASETISQAAERKESSHQTIVSVEEVGHTDDGADNVEESYDATVMKGDPSKLAKKKKKRLLPWWCIFFAWFLVFATCSLSAFFTMLYGFEYGREKAEAWVLTFLTSFFFDLAISQPIKILLIGFLFALIIKKPDSLEDDVPPAQLYEDEEFAGLQSDEIEDPIDETAPEQTGPPDQGALAVAREQRFVELGFRDACYDFVFYISYILLLLVIANGNRDQYFYRMSTHLRGTFVEPFSEVNDFESFWTFVRGSIVSDLHDVKWYNEEPLNRPGFLSDTSSFIVGHPRLRQVRVSPDVSCDVPDPMMSVVTDCDSLYSLLGSDDSSYDVGWTRVNVTFDVSSRENVSDDQVPWIYEPASLSAAVPDTGEHGTYYGGGYIVELSNSSNADMDIIDELQDVGWIDDNTRAVFIEFIVYNANANLFAVFNLLAEFTNLGRAFPQSEIMIVRLYPYTTAWGFVLLGCHGVFFLITLYLTYREARRILTLGTEYFKMFWRVVELVLSLLALAEVGVHLYTAYLILGFNNSQNSDNGDQRYNKYKQAASWEKINTYIIGWLVCVACLKLLYLCRFSKNIQRGPKVARKAWAPLSNFMIMFTIFFTAYSLFAHLVFGAKLGMYGTFIRTLETLFSVMLGDMNYDTVKSANDILGPLMLLSFVVLVSNILVLMFLAILSDAYSEVVEEEQIQGKSENDKIKDYAMYRLRKLLQKKPNSVDIAKHTCTSEAEISTISDRPISIPTRHMDGKSRMDYVSEEKNTSENELEQRGLEEDWQMLRSYYVGKLDVEDPVITWSEDPYREKRPEIEIARRRSSTCHPRRPSSGIDEAVVHESQISETAGSADMASSVDVTGGNQQNGVGTTGRCSSGVQTRRRSSGILHTTSEARSLDNESKCDGPAGSLRSVNVAEETRQEENRTVGRRNSGMPDTLPSTEIEDDSPNNTSIRESNRGNQARPVDLAWAAGPSGEKQEGEVGTDRGSGRLLKRQSTIVSFGGVELPLPGVFDLEVEDV
ncbi:uncharacterized protein LOC118413477 isoform X2 [Branchiostoma floridae]|uniref:Uncharacterized protein LOC118413477 isoform X2 n=1 Tax=Branchiostoma floridae TaxID=7739 RepID=A0A9J7MM13_BRAFL|nr:uncharacterized protein LOC118413477 isoform X2 [Branchiostoma floridae]